MKKTKLIILIFLSLGILSLLYILNRTQAVSKDSIYEVENSTQLAPQQVVENFYEWISEYEGNYLTSGAYKTSEYLSNEVIEKINQTLNSFDKGGYDPIICAQDLPNSFRVGSPQISDTTANVKLEQTFDTGKRLIPITLAKKNSAWLITDIGCQNLEPQSGLGEDIPSTNTIVLYFNNEIRKLGSDEDCGIVYGVERSVNLSDLTPEQKLNELFRGPSQSERSQGYSSVFNETTKGILNKIEIQNRTAKVYLDNSSSFVELTDSSCRIPDIKAQIEETLKHDRTIDTVEVYIDTLRI